MTNRNAYITRIENELGSRKLIWIGTRGHDAWYRLPHTGVNAPLHDHNPNFVSDTSPHVLEVAESGYVVHSCGAAYPARALPVPDYHDEKNASEEAYTSYAITHADRVRISPIEGCGMVCTFCDVPYEFRYRRRRLDGSVDSLARALEDRALPAHHVLISGGTPKPEDFDFLRTVHLEVPEAFPGIPVDIMMIPAPGLLNLPELREAGIHGLAINLEIYKQEIARRMMRPKYDLGLRFYLDFIEQAAIEFGPGRVRSLLLVGLEPLEETLEAVGELVRRGCDPVLSPFRPEPHTPLRDAPPPTVDFLEEAYDRAMEIVDLQGGALGPRCIPCMHNTLTFPGVGALLPDGETPLERLADGGFLK